MRNAVEGVGFNSSQVVWKRIATAQLLYERRVSIPHRQSGSNKLRRRTVCLGIQVSIPHRQSGSRISQHIVKVFERFNSSQVVWKRRNFWILPFFRKFQFLIGSLEAVAGGGSHSLASFNSSQVVWKPYLVVVSSRPSCPVSIPHRQSGSCSKRRQHCFKLVSIPHRQSGSGWSNRHAQRSIVEFQFLIGSLEAVTCPCSTRTYFMFQFLIGSLEAGDVSSETSFIALCFNSSQVVWKRCLMVRSISQRCFNSSQVVWKRHSGQSSMLYIFRFNSSQVVWKRWELFEEEEPGGEFQFLIGSLEAGGEHEKEATNPGFQFLIGSLEAKSSGRFVP